MPRCRLTKKAVKDILGFGEDDDNVYAGIEFIDLKRIYEKGVADATREIQRDMSTSISRCRKEANEK